MKFLVEVIDEHVKKLETTDDVAFIGRLNTIITTELQKYNDNCYRHSVRVRELAPDEKVVYVPWNSTNEEQANGRFTRPTNK